MEPVPLTADDPAPSVKDSGGTVIKLRDRVEDTSVCKFGLGTVVVAGHGRPRYSCPIS